MTQVVDAATCPSCGAPQPARFCEQCGEKRITTHDYSIVHFAEHLLETFTHFDFRALRAIYMLVAKPGLLTRDYLDGRRRRYVGPIQLFVIVNVLAAFTTFNTFRTPLYIQEHDPPAAAMKRAMVADAIAHRSVTHEEFAKAFDSNAGLQAKTWVFAMIPGFALLLMVLYGFRRYYFEHLVFAAHFYAFVLIWLVVGVISLVLVLRAVHIEPSGRVLQQGVGAVILAGLAVYLFFALRRTYGDGAIAATLRSLTLALLFYPVVQAYRLLLFFVTLYTMH